MAVVGSAVELLDSLSGGDSDKKSSFTRTFHVTVDDIEDDSIVVLGASGLPIIWQTYGSANSSNLYARCRDRKAKPLKDNRLIWKVTCQYSTPDGKDGDGQEEDNQIVDVLVELPEVTFGWEEEEIPVPGGGNPGGFNSAHPVFGTDGIVNSAGELFDPPPMMTRYNMVWTIVKNMADDFDSIDHARTYMNHLNSDEIGFAFWGFPAETVLCRSIVPTFAVKQLANQAQQVYQKVTYDFVARPQWDIVLLDQGSYYLSDAGGDIHKVFFEAGGSNIIGLLDGNGGKQPEPWTPASAVYLDPIEIHSRIPFSALDLPNRLSECKAVFRA
jgi:hypothetical protein